jgi:hypothetical protein
MKCTSERINQNQIGCKPDSFRKLEQVYFNPKTKEVFDMDENLIGYGELSNGDKTLTITKRFDNQKNLQNASNN